MDTRFWGPSAWQLLHLVAYEPLTPHHELFFNAMKDVLPCKFCRASTSEFMEKELPLHPRLHDLPRWIYDLHNRVNKKLRDQSKEDPTVRDPGPDPTFEEVQTRYKEIRSKPPKAVPGADFFQAMAYNYPEKPTSEHVMNHTVFWENLVPIFPFEKFRKVAKVPDLTSRSAYMHSVHAMLKKMCRGKGPTFQGMCQHVGYFKSRCNQPTYRGKTCRRSQGGYTKVRDHARTFRITHSRLLQ